MYETSSGHLASLPPERRLRDQLADEFYIIHDKAAVIQTVYYPTNDDQEAVAIKKGKT